MAETWQHLCEPHHLWLVIGALFLAVFLSGRFKPKEILQGLRSLFGREPVEVNINATGGTDMGEKACPIDPNHCPAHAEEHARSMANQDMIKSINAKLELIDKRSRLMLIAMVSGKPLTMQDVEGLV